MAIDLKAEVMSQTKYNAQLGGLVGEAVLVNPTVREGARKAVDSYIETMNNPVSLEAMGTKPLDIVDLNSDSRAPELVKEIKNWTGKDTLKHKVDVTELFPKWVYHEGQTIDGEAITLISPMVSIDPEGYFEQVNATLSWLRDSSRYVAAGYPRYVIVLPSDWINKGPLGYASCGRSTMSIMVTEDVFTEDPLLTARSLGNTVRHETNHAALLGDEERWGDANARVMDEGVDEIIELLMWSEGSLAKADEFLLESASTFVFSNPDIQKVGGYSEVATYRANKKKPNNKGEYRNSSGGARQAEYFQGLVLSYLICSEYGGVEALRDVFREVKRSQGDIERRLRRGIKKGLKLDNEGEAEFREKYDKFCKDYVTRARRVNGMTEETMV